jgi:hypothetical protein
MARDASVDPVLVIPDFLWKVLQAHLFPGDGDEHGAVIAAGVAGTGAGMRLIVRHVFVARDGIDYVHGQRGYRMLTATFVRDQALYCRDEKLAYLAVHNHGGRNSVAFSHDDLASHERGYPTLRDVVRGQIVGGLVFAKNAVAGDLWMPDGRRLPLRGARVVGGSGKMLYPSPPSRPPRSAPSYDRQARLFGDRGQALLATQKVGVIGLGGIGSLVCEYLARLGVGHLVLIDPERIEWTNVPRVNGSSPWDALTLFTTPDRPEWMRKLAARLTRRKTAIAERAARRANPGVQITSLAGSVVDADVVRHLVDCDYLFLAADSMQARLVFNAVVQQYAIPGVQLGAKVSVDKGSGDVAKVYSVVRPVAPGQGCLWCNGLILPDRLQEEALTPEERRAQRYVDEDEIPSPSVITLNAISAAHGVNDFLFKTTGLRSEATGGDFLYFDPQMADVRFEQPRRDPACRECGEGPASRFARGDGAVLPVRTREHVPERSIRSTLDLIWDFPSRVRAAWLG